ncbi:hypothetical protein IMZ48_40715 [Candidatus Bathyarchaeota archaeon]|nr:hypothetical protein [Candidatus Bathyarchaeota archaeon]
MGGLGAPHKGRSAPFLGSLPDWSGHDGRVRVLLDLPLDWGVVMSGHWDLEHFTRKMGSFWNGQYSLIQSPSSLCVTCWNHRSHVSLPQISHPRLLPNGYLAIPPSSNPVSSSNSSFTGHSIPPGMSKLNS